MIRIEDTPEGCMLPVRAQPGAKRNAILGEHDGSLKVSVTVAPDKGKANQAIAELLADAFDLPKSAVKLISGQTSRQKRFLLEGVKATTAGDVLGSLIADNK